MGSVKGPKGSPPERIDPEAESPGIVAHHLVKYDFAGKLIGRGPCLDIGCGLGYGTATLTGGRDIVVGVDVSSEAVEIGRRRYGASGALFVQMDGERLAFPPATFDAALCFEAIEHFHDPERHLSEVARILADPGVYVMSTPMPGTGGSPRENPFHHHEFSSEELTRLLRGFFSDVQIAGQRRLRNSVQRTALRMDVLGLRRLPALKPIARVLSHAMRARSTVDARVEDFVIGEVGEDTTELVAVARKL